MLFVSASFVGAAGARYRYLPLGARFLTFVLTNSQGHLVHATCLQFYESVSAAALAVAPSLAQAKVAWAPPLVRRTSLPDIAEPEATAEIDLPEVASATADGGTSGATTPSTLRGRNLRDTASAIANAFRPRQPESAPTSPLTAMMLASTAVGSPTLVATVSSSELAEATAADEKDAGPCEPVLPSDLANVDPSRLLWTEHQHTVCVQQRTVHFG